ncbi:SGNH/GDSL hydrolase family protein [Labedaea rhizosphaerae]|uniref:GDSL-like lipase/acylhydrolase family protein n=1 Tax=Labedaea rhizosphaerae TaxID=598644 RepID=A0A4R6S5A3_LABRH|nr:SGNH/GDSL hydrolase family protein [Labedaea rhizosphaerae]TDP93915.1 GDSL-like lipase/acylhydrolase family protein [Labedaea rhizosphaerae]
MRGRAAGAVVMMVLALIMTSAASQATAAPRSWAAPVKHYVALGDSYAAGPGIPTQHGTPAGCARSDHNYSTLLAAALHVRTFTDATCSGATTVHMTQPQQVSGGVAPPQFDALTKDTDLVSVTISGNDTGFGEILATCGALARQDPTGNPCEQHYGASGTDELAKRIEKAAPLVDAVLAGIRARAPHARVLVVGYLRILPAQGSCFPTVPFAAGDGPYFDSVERQLNKMVATEARKAGDRFVDTYTWSYGHDACQEPGRKWVEGLVPQSPAAPMHPNATGMAVVAGLSLLGTLFPF